MQVGNALEIPYIPVNFLPLATTPATAPATYNSSTALKASPACGPPDAIRMSQSPSGGGRAGTSDAKAGGGGGAGGGGEGEADRQAKPGGEAGDIDLK